MATKTEIVNFALGRLGKARIQDINQPSGTAQVINDVYDITRKSVLREFPWGFALKTADLTLTGNTPPDFSYEFQLPSDHVRTASLMTNGVTVYKWNWTTAVLNRTNAEYKRRADKLLINIQEITMEYVYNLTETTYFDPLFTECLGLRLARDTAYQFTKDAQIVQALSNEYARKLGEAKANSAEENHTTTTLNTTYMAARNSASLTDCRWPWRR